MPKEHSGDLAVARAARVLPDAPWRAEADPKLLRYLLKNGHTSPFEQVVVKLEVKAPIFVLRQWMRHRTQSYNEQSARYSELDEEFYVPQLSVVGTQAATNKQARELSDDSDLLQTRTTEVEGYAQQCEASFASYRELLAAGWPRELARCVLPLSTYSRMGVTANLHNWLRFLKERLATNAQLEVREYAKAVRACLAHVAPLTLELWEKLREPT